MPESGKAKGKKKNKAAAKAKEADSKVAAETPDHPQAIEEGDQVESSESAKEQEGQPHAPDLTSETTISENGPNGDTMKHDVGDKEDSLVDCDVVKAPNSTLGVPPDALQPKDRFDALVRDRDSLRAEVADMRRSLEEIQLKHSEEMKGLQHKLDDAEGKREHAETQFQKLLERVNTIKSQLGERLKEDAEELAQTRSKIEDLEDQNTTLKEDLLSRAAHVEDLTAENEQKTKEISTLRERTNLSQQNWLKEKEELSKQESYLQSEFEQAKEAMHNWEVLAMEERSIRENLGEKILDLEEQLVSLRDAYEKASVERDSQSATVDGLQRALQEIQAARKQELRELVESSDAQVEELKQALNGAETKAAEAKTSLQDAQVELERVRPFEKEVKEKNLLIGKLRHEAVTLNDHLTKALRFLKKGKPEDNVDRHIVTNHLLHFLALDRSDPKKFQILQLIGALLGWTDEQREQAGLARPGASGPTAKLRIPSTSIHRTPSTPSLATDFLDNGNASKESLAELWSNFLEQESQVAQESTPQKP
ncbi:hypothetical protein FE257_010147 [Aspergillus nanangensis]|uniref:GRIP domain-containing protein n=1 Tax=Aspergillus nanangensis TaxID=2582783 RepID=A0AAD4CJ22_ASPNN|nr:hypothetical protein FE257_010147 [Aspergillus nanangensis]